MIKFDGLVTCPHRKVDDGGKVLCGLIKGGDREVSLDLCRVCPVPKINCQHLRAAMQKKVSSPITVRFATGRVEVWDDEAPTIGFKQAACAVKAMPIHSARDCAGCPLRLAHAQPQTAAQVAGKTKPAISGVPMVTPPDAVSVEQPVAAIAGRRASRSSTREVEQGGTDARAIVSNVMPPVGSTSSSRTASADAAARKRTESAPKIILFQKWLADQFGKKKDGPADALQSVDSEGVQDIMYSPVVPSREEESGYERCVGWTD